MVAATNSQAAAVKNSPSPRVKELGKPPEGINLHDEAIQTESTTSSPQTDRSCRPRRIYTRPQILSLSKSPLVQLPPGMPELKDWFGSENEQNVLKKENEPPTPGSARERRFKRDMDDGDALSRLSFRSTPSQPSQMGNFKHQSLRGGDRDRDRDPDKERERDVRDKEGHERLRHLSDKYDRDRLTLPPNARNKERDLAPHLNTGTSSRMSSQTHVTPGSSRRGDTRDIAKKKAGEVSEDWRKGPDLRSTREERSENGRKEREERDRARSRGRESSRPRRDPSTSRRDREKDMDQSANDDPRRWRDDGKRDERMAARRAERHAERFKEKEPVLEPADRRWVAAEDRESRPKRSSGRDRKTGPRLDDSRDRDERRDRDREREEKEPAWMDTYIPSPSSVGILGGKALNGELDSIQVWKKERKERELKDKDNSPIAQTTGADSQAIPGVEPSETRGTPLDEIQLFRLLMKREEERKKSDAHPDGLHNDLAEQNVAVSSLSKAPPGDGISSITPQPEHAQQSNLSQPEIGPSSAIHNPTSLLSLLGKERHGTPVTSEGTQDSSNISPHASNNLSTSFPADIQSAESLARDSTPFNPPTGSRLLAFGRSSAAISRPQTLSNVNNNSTTSSNNASPNLGVPQPELSQYIPPKTDTIQSSPSFSPFEDTSRSPYSSNDSRAAGNLPILPDTHRRVLAERQTLIPSSEHPPFLDSSPEAGSGYSAGKGSRFAKFFDAKVKEGGTPTSKAPDHTAVVSSSPGPGSQRQDQGFNGSYGNTPDPRTMDEIYAMLNSSVQTSQGAPAHLSNNGGFGLQPPNNFHLYQQQQLHAGRLESLYESRLDDRNFAPDGMVPGLRSAPSPRNRENLSLYTDNSDEIPFNIQQRIPPPQPRHLDPLYPGGPPSVFVQQNNRNPGIPLQHNQYRGGPSPHQQNHIQNSQRLPPGLANLGGRPPHDPLQFLGMPSVPSPGQQSTLHLNGSSQHQPLNNFPGYAGVPIRGPHQLQNHTSHLPVPGVTHLGGTHDLRAAGQNQLLGMGVGHRGTGFPNQQGPGQIPPLMRQQQQQLPPHIMPHIPPPHMQQQGPNSQPAHDLMALLMGGSHRE